MEEFVVNANGTVRQAGADHDLTSQLRDVSERSLYAFSKGVLGMTAFVPHLHLPLCNWLQEVPPRERVLLAPRGTFKTSMAMALGLHVIIQPTMTNCYLPGKLGRNLRVLYAAENLARAVSRITRIRRVLLTNDLFRALWPECVWPDESAAPIWTTERFAIPRVEDWNEATFEAAGVDSGSTGGHYDVIVKDDLIGQRCLKQPQLIPAAISWWQTSHSLRNDPKTSLDYVFGTRWASEDLYSWVMENEETYEYRTLSVFKPDGSLLFPERLPRDLLEQYKRTKGPVYYLNYENRPIGEGTTAFNMALCGSFSLDRLDRSGTIKYDESGPTKQILEIIDKGNTPPPGTKVQPKRFYRMTPEERVVAFDEMVKRWTNDRFNLKCC